MPVCLALPVIRRLDVGFQDMNDKQACRFLLNSHSEGLGLLRLLKRSSRLFIFRTILIGIGLYLYFGSGNVAFILAVGVFIGALAQDLGWFWKIGKYWPLTEKITNWEKVEEIATDES